MSDPQDPTNDTTALCQRGGRRVTEIRIEVPAEEVAVLDGYCNANGLGRTEVVRGLLREWSERQLHIATLVCRTAGVNPMSPEPRP